MLAMQKTALDPGDSVGQSPTCAAAAAGRLRLSLGEAMDEIGAADDTDHPAFAQHRHAFDAVGGQQTRDLVDLGLLVDRDYRRCHDIACSPFRGAEGCEKIGVKRLS